MKHMETVRLTASQALVRFLENQYVSYIDMDGNEQEHKFVKGIFMPVSYTHLVCAVMYSRPILAYSYGLALAGSCSASTMIQPV